MSTQKMNQAREGPEMQEVFGFRIPTRGYYLHRGHTWIRIEAEDRVKVGVDDFSQKILGPADAVKLPEIGREYYQDHIFLALLRQGHKAPFLAPVDGQVAAINEAAAREPRLIHDDPYGEGWLLEVRPTNLKHNLEHLLTGEAAVAFISEEAHRLLHLMEAKVGVTLPTGGTVVDDVYGHYPQLGWRPLVQDLFLPTLSRTWRKRVGDLDAETLRREVFRILARAVEDPVFAQALRNLRAEVLEGYHLPEEAKTALLAGDLAWLNEHIGELTQKQLRFIRSCLMPNRIGRAGRRAVS